MIHHYSSLNNVKNEKLKATTTTAASHNNDVQVNYSLDPN